MISAISVRVIPLFLAEWRWKVSELSGIPCRRAVTGVWTLRTPLLWLAGCSVLVVHGPGVQLFLPGVDALQAQALAAVLMEETP